MADVIDARPHPCPPHGPRSSGRESAPTDFGEELEPTHDGCHGSGVECANRSGNSHPSAEAVPLPPFGQNGASALQGSLEITCSLDSSGRSCLSRQAFHAPFHISKPYCDGHALSVQVINPTAGLFAGDRLQSIVTVESGATLRITNPSATRVYTMPEGRGEVLQTFHVASGATLVFVPSMLVPQRDSCLHQRTQLFVESGGELIYVDSLAPGRVASGEVAAFRELSIATELFEGTRWNACERFRLAQGQGAGLKSAAGGFRHGYYASCYIVTSRLDSNHGCWEALSALHTDDAWVGVSRLAVRGWSVRMLCRDSHQLRGTIRSMLAILEAPIPALRGLGRFLP